MKHLKPYKLFESSRNGLTPEQIDILNKGINSKGKWEYNEKTGLVDIKGNFSYLIPGAKDFNGIKFGVVTKDFSCYGTKLTSLEGAPKEVLGNFHCRSNKLTSLEGAPQKVEGDFYCDYNELTSLEGAPQEVEGSFSCTKNQLTSLEGAPQKVGGIFSCNDNKLASLKGAPQEVEGNFSCTRNQLSSLKGAPQKLKGGFYCDHFDTSVWSKEWVIENIDKYPILSTIASVELLQDMINKNPGEMVMKLKNIWKELKKFPNYASLEFPEGYKDTAKLVGDLSDLGM